MVIILIDLPSNAFHKDIENFIRPAIKHGHMGSIAIISQQKSPAHETKRHALVRITPDSAATRAIEQLNGKPLCGKVLDVHEYKTRYWHNDPRIRSIRNNSNNLRKGERRQFL